MFTEELVIPTGGRPIEAFAMYRGNKPTKGFVILPGKGYTINHFLLDFLWRMAAENGFYAVKAEYRGFTYRHMDEPYDEKHAIEDAGFVFNYLQEHGIAPQKSVACVKSLGTIALAGLLQMTDLFLDKAVLLTPVTYFEKGTPVLSLWDNFNSKVSSCYAAFGTEDPYCDRESAVTVFPDALIDCFEGADHGLNIAGDYDRTIEIQRHIIKKVEEFIR